MTDDDLKELALDLAFVIAGLGTVLLFLLGHAFHEAGLGDTAFIAYSVAPIWAFMTVVSMPPVRRRLRESLVPAVNGYLGRDANA